MCFVGCVGDDAYGGQVIDNLKKDGIDTRHVFQEEGVASGTALIMIDAAGENCISVAPGANYRLTPGHVDRARPAIEEAAAVIAQCEIPPETLDHVIDLGARLGKMVLLNLAPARPLSDALAREARRAGGERDRGRVPHRAAGRDRRRRPRPRPPRSSPEGRRWSSSRWAPGARGSRWRVTRGSSPASRWTRSTRTAAGDVHCGALAVALVEGQALLEAVAFANAAAALSVTRLGAQPSAPARADIDALLASR